MKVTLRNIRAGRASRVAAARLTLFILNNMEWIFMGRTVHVSRKPFVPAKRSVFAFGVMTWFATGIHVQTRDGREYFLPPHLPARAREIAWSLGMCFVRLHDAEIPLASSKPAASLR
jgi:hypothetical protein